MSQSTKLFIALALLFVLYATMKGHLQAYLALLWGNSSGGKIVHQTSDAGQIQQAAGYVFPSIWGTK